MESTLTPPPEEVHQIRFPLVLALMSGNLSQSQLTITSVPIVVTDTDTKDII